MDLDAWKPIGLYRTAQLPYVPLQPLVRIVKYNPLTKKIDVVKPVGLVNNDLSRV
jgi:hypothetical protein